jgi:formamidopyrimidine-DNA glycosylase
MPELPEVETVARLIRPRLLGRTVLDVAVGWARSLGGLSPQEFRRGVVGARLSAVWRRGKHVVLDLERGGDVCGWLLCHLGMSGRIHVEGDVWEAGPHLRVRLDLDRGQRMYFIDVRKFGRVRYERDLARALGRVGPEPLSEEFTAGWLQRELRARRRMLKPLLLDQSFVAGLGNIYVDESLHRAQLHPLRSSHGLDDPSVVRLHAAIQCTLREAIEREGSSFDAFYRTPEGQPGSYQEQFRVYGRQGKPCGQCGGTVFRLVVGQRGTHVCLRCQRPPRRLRSTAILGPNPPRLSKG